MGERVGWRGGGEGARKRTRGGGEGGTCRIGRSGLMRCGRKMCVDMKEGA